MTHNLTAHVSYVQRVDLRGGHMDEYKFWLAIDSILPFQFCVFFALHTCIGSSSIVCSWAHLWVSAHPVYFLVLLVFCAAILIVNPYQLAQLSILLSQMNCMIMHPPAKPWALARHYPSDKQYSKTSLIRISQDRKKNTELTKCLIIEGIKKTVNKCLLH